MNIDIEIAKNLLLARICDNCFYCENLEITFCRHSESPGDKFSLKSEHFTDTVTVNLLPENKTCELFTEIIDWDRIYR